MKLENMPPSSNIETILYDLCPKGDLPISSYHPATTTDILFIAAMMFAVVIAVAALFKLGGHSGN